MYNVVYDVLFIMVCKLNAKNMIGPNTNMVKRVYVKCLLLQLLADITYLEMEIGG